MRDRGLLIDARISRGWLTGIGQYTRALVAAMRARQPSLRIGVVLLPGVHNPFADQPAVHIHRCPVRPAAPAQHRAIARLAASEGYDVVFATHPLTATVGSGGAHVAVVHDVEPLLFPPYYSRVVRLYLRWVFPPIARRQFTLITVSRQTQRDLTEHLGIAPRHCAVVHSAADHLAPPTDRGEAEATRQRYGIGAPYVLYHGNKRPHKNVGAVIAAYASLPDALHAQFPLVITGKDDPTEAEFDLRPLQSAIERHGVGRHVRFTGAVAPADLSAIYAGARAFVFPSRYEGFGLPVLEAMRCGVPVICSTAGSLPEVAGGAALLVGPTDLTTLGHALEHVLTDDALAADLAERGRKRAAGFSWTRTATETLQALGLG